MNTTTDINTIESPSKSALESLASRLSMEPKRAMEVLKKTAFSACKNDEQFAALVVVSNEYGLNPFLKEIYAFPAKGGQIVPIVSIDGWLRIINDHAQFNGMSEKWADDGSWCEITIYRKDRDHPTVHREWLEEVLRPTEPWKQHTKRMLKWKTIMQAGRVAFGFGGIYDEDEGRAVAQSSEPRNITPRSEPINPFDSAPSKAIESKKEAPKKREKKERYVRKGFVVDITQRDLPTGKTVWIIVADLIDKYGKEARKEIECWSSTKADELGAVIGEDIEFTITFNAKGVAQLDSYEVANEGGLI